MSEYGWAAESLRAHGVPEAIVADVSATAEASLASAMRLAAALSPGDPLPLILDTAGDAR
ncbi:hypothetical protein [Rhodococcoides kyotonense]|uniref:Uncharacterized protein n=1 Tax=Rhodococcoides kyotonense TaxID=398843 RepID=A0A239HJX1_9NOCA|nr:hypothetical protein [Rhodococcus kyotonensis]SNS81647.1 hypothetical protein SAMN05421642_105312 [Rhodococcus kyotonensis]